MLTGHETLRLLRTIASVDYASAGWYCASVRYLCCDGSTLTLRCDGRVTLSSALPWLAADDQDDRTELLIDQKTARARMARDAAAVAAIAERLEALAALSDKSAADYRARAARRRSRMGLRQLDRNLAQYVEQRAADTRRRAAEWRASDVASHP